MRPGLCHRPLVPVLCLLLCLVASAPARAAERVTPSDGPTIGAEVARLYEEAALATQTYEHGRRAARVQRARADRLERLLTAERRGIKALHANLGRVARAQYRVGGGGIEYTAQLLLADDPEELMNGQRLAWQADLAVSRMLERAERAERKLATDERVASAVWRDLTGRTERLAGIKRGIQTKLEDARWKLQSDADRSVAAGRCAGAVRLEQRERPATRAWVAPVETYELSAGFGGSGARWSNRHTGQDFAVDIGTPVRSVGAGRVVSVSCGGGFGIEVVVGHPGGYYSQYAHLAGVTIDQGEKVRAGQWLGQAGTTGNSSGPHLHFEVRLTPYLGSGVDPARWLREHGVKL
ncbi:M23 family metallopeptidase [Streptomyces sp. H27-C3]|uniref:M23 family metallopeptidase n=1 Tax=Streptomyces sp. H27-C3 TaxID=3046305 RepID=UPI0024BB0CA4|nr:M23 family metallopeptidase [Streptomyces sp. H27-C3]MDJ0463402.1 M23 family metallopeptidase [Streptomyces sp. H27-C3]